MDNVGWLNQLTFRTTYGYNGNIDPGQYPFTNISFPRVMMVLLNYHRQVLLLRPILQFVGRRQVY